MDAAPFWDAVDRVRRWSRRFWPIATVVAITLFVSHYRRNSSGYCAVCASRRSTNESGFGFSSAATFPLWTSEAIEPSAAFRDLCDPGHRHDWRIDHVGDTKLFGGRFCGGWSRGPFAFEYETSADLRDLVRREITNGTLDRATALRLVAVPRHSFEARRAAPGTLPDAALLATAERILRAHFVTSGRNAEAEVRFRLRRMGG